MGVPAREAGHDTKDTAMTSTILERRRTWRSLSTRDKHERLQDLRRRHQSHVELEILRLSQQVR